MVGSGRKFRSFPVVFLLPNIITLTGLCMGLSAIRYAMNERWEMAVIFLVVAAIIDGMDGRLARLLNATSTFGAELDSLADFISFGVAPVFVMYLWQLHNVKGLGWFIVLFFAVCMAMRLARFNSRIFSASESKQKNKDEHFFSGVPAPVGAMLSLLPMVLYFQFEAEAFTNPYFCIVHILIIALLMVSTLPTISIKKFKIRHSYAGVFMLLSALWIAGWIIEPWVTFLISAGLYIATIPWGFWRYYCHYRESQYSDS